MAHKTLTTALTVMALGLSMNALAFTPDLTEIDGRAVPMIDWKTTLEKFQFQKDKFVGQRFTAMCPSTTQKAKGEPDKNAVYPRSHSICSAGLQAGAIDSKGGLVTVQLNKENMSVVGHADANVTDKIYREHIPQVNWDTKFTSTGFGYKQLIGQRFSFQCPKAPGNMRSRRVVGTDSYAFKSMICRAAVHAGSITTDGGLVTVQMNPGTAKLAGSTRNGIETKDGMSGLSALSFVKKPSQSIIFPSYVKSGPSVFVGWGQYFT